MSNRLTASTRCLRQRQLSRKQAQRRNAQQLTAAQQKAELLDRVEAHIRAIACAETTARLIDELISRYPDCPGTVSLLVDRLLVGQEGLEAAIRLERGQR